MNICFLCFSTAHVIQTTSLDIQGKKLKHTVDDGGVFTGCLNEEGEDAIVLG